MIPVRGIVAGTKSPLEDGVWVRYGDGDIAVDVEDEGGGGGGGGGSVPGLVTPKVEVGIAADVTDSTGMAVNTWPIPFMYS
jgi:hypothetical protein